MQFLHEHPDFKDLIELTAQAENIKDPSLIEKDYWLMHVLWSLQQLDFSFHLKGGTSLAKGYSCIQRFSEDIDLKIEPDEKTCGIKVYDGKNHDEEKHRVSRQKYFDWVTQRIQQNISGIVEVKRDKAFDDIPKYRNGGIRLLYEQRFGSTQGLKDGILLEVGFDRTAPNRPCDISSWAFEHARKSSVPAIDNRALKVPCYEPRYTFVEKLQAVVRKFRLYKEGKKGANLPENFIRHYYDIFQLIDRKDVREFIGTPEYSDFKKERFGSDDTVVANSDAFKLSSKEDRAIFEKEYSRSESLYYHSRPTLEEILKRIARDLDRL